MFFFCCHIDPRCADTYKYELSVHVYINIKSEGKSFVYLLQAHELFVPY